MFGLFILASLPPVVYVLVGYALAVLHPYITKRLASSSKPVPPPHTTLPENVTPLATKNKKAGAA